MTAQVKNKILRGLEEVLEYVKRDVSAQDLIEEARKARELDERQEA
jgi:hypothetical protein